MKKLSFLIGLFAIAGVIFTSCSKDEDTNPEDLKPTITFKTGTGLTSSDVTMDQGDSITIGILATANSNSGAKLQRVRIYMIVDNNPQSAIVDTSFNESNFSANYTITFPDVVDGKLYAEVTDKDNLKSEVSINVTVNSATTPLAAAEDLTWERVGGSGNPSTGLDMFGLKWTSNGKKVDAKITKDGADKFVKLDAAMWTSIETVEDLMTAVNDGTDMDTYTGISADASNDYDEVLAVMNNDEYYIIHLTHADVVSPNSFGGTTITIDGMYKK